MENDYSLENLISRFGIHLDFYLKDKQEREQEYKQKFNKPMPKYGPDPDFIITKALLTICNEIKELKTLK